MPNNESPPGGQNPRASPPPPPLPRWPTPEEMYRFPPARAPVPLPVVIIERPLPAPVERPARRRRPVLARPWFWTASGAAAFAILAAALVWLGRPSPGDANPRRGPSDPVFNPLVSKLFQRGAINRFDDVVAWMNEEITRGGVRTGHEELVATFIGAMDGSWRADVAFWEDVTGEVIRSSRGASQEDRAVLAEQVATVATVLPGVRPREAVELVAHLRASSQRSAELVSRHFVLAVKELTASGEISVEEAFRLGAAAQREGISLAPVVLLADSFNARLETCATGAGRLTREQFGYNRYARTKPGSRERLLLFFDDADVRAGLLYH